MTAGRPRVLLVGPSAPARGGMATVVETLASLLGGEFEVGVVNTAKTTPVGRAWHVGLRAQLRLLSRASRAMSRHADLVHIHTCSGPGFWRDAVFFALARLYRRRVVWHVHGGGFEDFIERMPPVLRRVLVMTLSSGHALVVVSESWRARLARHLHPRRWVVIENGVSLPLVPAAASTSDRVLFVGTLDDTKGARDVVTATAMAARGGFGGRITMVGPETSPGQADTLRRLADREGLAGRIDLTGTLAGQEKLHAFETAGFFLLPSYVEALPLALLEAMAYGLPSIVTNVGAIPDVVTDGVDGFLIQPGDVHALADRMLQLASDPALREKMGAAARQRVAERYSSDRMAAKTADLYRAVLEER